MRRKAQSYCWDVLNAITEIRAFVDNVDYMQFAQNKMMHLAVERSFENIGEALRQARSIYKEQFASVADLQVAVDMRNRLAHGYFDVKHETIWTSIEIDLPTLETSIMEVLSALPQATLADDGPL